MKKIFITILFIIPTFIFAQQGIIGGTSVPIEDAPYQASLVDWTVDQNNTNIRFRCGAVIISDTWILTAAHCITNIIPSIPSTYINVNDLEVNYGVETRGPYNPNNIILETAQTPVKGIYPHPLYVPVGGTAMHSINDLALVELVDPIEFNHRKMPVLLANTCNTTLADVQEPVLPNTGKPSFLTGWGKTSPSNNAPFSTVLKGTDIDIISNTNADQILASNLIGPIIPGFNNDMINFFNGTSTNYHGDSGGPAVIDKNGNKINIGIASFSFKGSAFPVNLPTTYTNVRNFENFIAQPSPGVFTNLETTTQGIDLYTKDKPWDMGAEPFPNPLPYTSEDIWVRNQNDGIANQDHQNPIHSVSGTNPNYIYVRVTNRGCTASNGGEELKVYWAKAATALAWPNNWDGSLTVSDPSTPSISYPLGGQVGITVTLPVIQPGDAYIAELPWYPEDPNNYVGLNQSNSQIFRDEPHHFCLLSRIVNSPTDPIVNETTDVWNNVIVNNNIAWRNLTVVNGGPGSIVGNGNGGQNDVPNGGTVTVGGVGDQDEVYDLVFCDAPQAGEISITEVAEVKVTLDEELWLAWEGEGFPGENYEFANEDLHQIVLTDPCARINGFTFDEFEQRLIHVSFNFLAEDIQETGQFHFSVNQVIAEGDKPIGGEYFEVNAPVLNDFEANAGENLEIEEGQTVHLSALTIGEDAIYNWYDEGGELVYTGTNLTVSPTVSQKYKLEVIATLDGFKDYDEVDVIIKKNKIVSVSPNPANSFIDVNYKTDGVSSAYLMLVQNLNSTSSQFILNLNEEETQLNVSSLERGNYSLVLICDGEVQDHKNILLD